MDEEERKEWYPLKSLHDFLSELDVEWERFRTASMMGMVISAALLVLLAYRFMIFLAMLKHKLKLFQILDDMVFLILVSIFVVYEIYLLLRQYKFFQRWERRIGLLIHLEEKLLEGYETSKETPTNTGTPREKGKDAGR